MPTCSVRIRTDRGFANCPAGFTFIELMAGIVLMGLFVTMASISFTGAMTKHSFGNEIHQFAATFERATNAAARGNKRYEIFIDIIDQRYLFSEIKGADLDDIREEDVLKEHSFGKNCTVVYVQFDDLVYTDPDHQQAIFRVGKAGWQNGGKIVFHDKHQRPHTVIINRIGTIELHEGDIPLLMPRSEDELDF